MVTKITSQKRNEIDKYTGLKPKIDYNGLKIKNKIDYNGRTITLGEAFINLFSQS
jgi:hypothetical protein